MSECIFCQIVSGDIQAKTVYENQYALAFLDVSPLVDGHTVVIPKKHFERFEDLDQETAGGMFQVLQKVQGAIMSGLHADGANIGLNDGEVAGQAVPHTHVHVIPRYSNDGGGSLHSIVKSENLSDLDQVQGKLLEHL